MEGIDPMNNEASVSITGELCVREGSMVALRSHRRFVAQVNINGEIKRKDFVRLLYKDRIYWADIVTGTLYDEQTGRSSSSAMTIHKQPSNFPEPFEAKAAKV